MEKERKNVGLSFVVFTLLMLAASISAYLFVGAAFDLFDHAKPIGQWVSENRSLTMLLFGPLAIVGWIAAWKITNALTKSWSQK